MPDVALAELLREADRKLRSDPWHSYGSGPYKFRQATLTGGHVYIGEMRADCRYFNDTPYSVHADGPGGTRAEVELYATLPQAVEAASRHIQAALWQSPGGER